MTTCAYRYKDFGDNIISPDGRMFGSKWAIPTKAALTALAKDFLIIDRELLPKVASDGRLGYGGHEGKPSDHIGKAEFFRSEAYGKLALAEWNAKEADADARRIAAMKEDLEQTLQTGDFEAFATSLIRRGWRNPPFTT